MCPNSKKDITMQLCRALWLANLTADWALGYELPCFVLFSWSVYPTPLARNLRANAAKVKVYRNVVQQSFVVFTIGEMSYTVVYQKYMKENVISSEISIQNKAEMLFQMERHRTYFQTRKDTRLTFVLSKN